MLDDGGNAYTCNSNEMITSGPHADVVCGFTGRTVRLEKEVSGLLIIHAIAILGDETSGCSSCDDIAIIHPKYPLANSIALNKWYGRLDSGATHETLLLAGMCLNQLSSCSFTHSLLLNDGSAIEEPLEMSIDS